MGDRDSDPPAQENSLGGRATGNHRRQGPCHDDDGTRSRGAINRDSSGRRFIPCRQGPCHDDDGTRSRGAINRDSSGRQSIKKKSSKARFRTADPMDAAPPSAAERNTFSNRTIISNTLNASSTTSGVADETDPSNIGATTINGTSSTTARKGKCSHTTTTTSTTTTSVISITGSSRSSSTTSGSTTSSTTGSTVPAAGISRPLQT